MYMKGKYQFTKSTNLTDFYLIDNEVTMNFKPRHGTVLPITSRELKELLKKWGTPAGLGKINNNPVLPGYYADPEILYAEKTRRLDILDKVSTYGKLKKTWKLLWQQKK